jgi:hypothetical protein
LRIAFTDGICAGCSARFRREERLPPPGPERIGVRFVRVVVVVAALLILASPFLFYGSTASRRHTGA